MLTPEDRARIEQEELRRLAEESYRAEVRARLGEQNYHAPKEGGNEWKWVAGALVVALIVVSVVALAPETRGDGKEPGPAKAATVSGFLRTPKTRYVDKTDSIVSKPVSIDAGGYVRYRITVPPNAISPVIVGRFHATGGAGNDIVGALADPLNIENFINGHAARVYWSTQGKQTAGTIEARVPPGECHLLFSNRFSTFSRKLVYLDVALKYKVAETYYE